MSHYWVRASFSRKRIGELLACCHTEEKYKKKEVVLMDGKRRADRKENEYRWQGKVNTELLLTVRNTISPKLNQRRVK